MDPALPIDNLMDPTLYEALVEGYEDVDDGLWKVGGRQVTPKGNTILHVVALHGHTHLVQKILEQQTYASSLLSAQNKKKETALHIAASKGHTDVVSALICYAKTRPELESGIRVTDILRMMDEDKDTALHKAVRKGHLEVVKLLVKEDPKFEFPANEAGETPVYLAAELQSHGCLLEILNNCERPVYGGPLGRTALHAAIINRAPRDCRKLLLEKEASLCEAADNWGWTPLHYAVRLQDKNAVCDILGVKSNAAYIPAGKGGEWTTAIHIAVSQKCVVLFKQLIQSCPLCWEMVNSEGQNVLHEAILKDSTEMIKYILNNSPKGGDDLIDEKDKEGNTPLHLLAAYDIYVPELKYHPRFNAAVGVVFNKQNLTPLDIAESLQAPCQGLFDPVFSKYDATKVDKMSRCGDLTKRAASTKNYPPIRMDMIQLKRKYDVDRRFKYEVERGKTYSVVAALIVTLTFAAGMTLPGGYNDNEGDKEEGMPILLRKSAFKAFVVTDAIAFVCSIASLIGFCVITSEIRSIQKSKFVAKLGLYSIITFDISVSAVVLAFVTGMFAVLTLHSSAVAVGVCIVVSVCIIGILSFPTYVAWYDIVSWIRKLKIN